MPAVSSATPTSGKPAGRRDFGLDAIRAAAITMVLTTHSGLFAMGSINYRSGVLPALGFLGVELFFGLSGYLIGSILLSGRHTMPTFYLRRLAKILPPYLLGLALIMIFMPQAGGWGSFFSHLFFIQDFFPEQVLYFPVSWSLAIEFWFYLLIPLMLLPAIRWAKGRQLLVACVGLLLLILAARWIYVINAHPTWEFGIHRFVPLRFDALLFGVLAAIIEFRHHRLHRWLVRREVAILGLVVLGALAATFGMLFLNQVKLEEATWFKSIGLSAVGASICVLVLAAKHHLSLAKPWPIITPAITWLSQISYSLYLIHLFIFFFFGSMLGGPGLWGNPWWLLGLSVSSSLVLSWVTYELFEVGLVLRARHWVEKRWFNRAKPVR